MERYHDNSSTDISSRPTVILSVMTFLAEIEAGVMKRIRCHLPFCRFDGYFPLKAGICAVVTKVLESFGTGLVCRAFSSN